MPNALPPEILDFLIRTLPSRALWAWLGEDSQSALRARLAKGFRATAEVLRQPVARTRFVSHLQNSPEDFQALLQLWSADAPKILDAVRAAPEDETLIAQLPLLQAVHGGEALVLALLFEEREAVLEALTEIDATPESATDIAAESTPIADVDALQKQLHRAQTKVEQLRAKAHDAKTNAAKTEKILREKLRVQEQAAREATRQARQHELKTEALAAKLEEAEKTRDRAERKARSTQGESEDAQAEAKTLRRQIHRLQQINEELRRRVSALQSTPAAPPTEKPTVSKTEIDPQETSKRVTGVLKSPRAVTNPDFLPGLQITLVEFQTAVERNDEATVAATAAALEVLREQNADKAGKAVKAIRKLGRYYERVLCHPTTRVLVDASNVARHDGPGKGKLEYLRAMREELRRYDFFPIVFVADASLPYHIDNADEFRRMMKTGEIMVSASGQEADEILARMARETGAYVVTNDRNFHRHLAPAFTPSRVGFQIFENVVVLEEF